MAEIRIVRPETSMGDALNTTGTAAEELTSRLYDCSNALQDMGNASGLLSNAYGAYSSMADGIAGPTANADEQLGGGAYETNWGGVVGIAASIAAILELLMSIWHSFDNTGKEMVASVRELKTPLENLSNTASDIKGEVIQIEGDISSRKISAENFHEDEAGTSSGFFPIGITNTGIDGSASSFMLNMAQGITDSTDTLQGTVQDAFNVIPACIDQTMGQANSLVQQDMSNISASIEQGMQSASAAFAQTSADMTGFSASRTDSLDNAASSADDAISSMGGGFDSLSQAAASVDADFSALDDTNDDWLTNADDMGSGSGGGSRRSVRRGRRSAGSNSAWSGGAQGPADIASAYAQAAAGLAEAQNPALETEFGAEFAQSLQVQYQAQVNAYQEMMGINTIGGASSSGGSGGVTVQISGITVNSTGNINDSGDLASQVETAIAQNIQRNASQITTALKQVGI